jgi:hypothetical protein
MNFSPILSVKVHQFPKTSNTRHVGFLIQRLILGSEELLLIGFSRISTPRTKYSPEPINTVPLYGLDLMKQVIGGLFPELRDIGFTDSRVCSFVAI